MCVEPLFVNGAGAVLVLVPLLLAAAVGLINFAFDSTVSSERR